MSGIARGNTNLTGFHWSAFVAMAVYLNSVNVDIEFHLDCKLHFPRAQFVW